MTTTENIELCSSRFKHPWAEDVSVAVHLSCSLRLNSTVTFRVLVLAVCFLSLTGWSAMFLSPIRGCRTGAEAKPALIRFLQTSYLFLIWGKKWSREIFDGPLPPPSWTEYSCCIWQHWDSARLLNDACHTPIFSACVFGPHHYTHTRT